MPSSPEVRPAPGANVTPVGVRLMSDVRFPERTHENVDETVHRPCTTTPAGMVTFSA